MFNFLKKTITSSLTNSSKEKDSTSYQNLTKSKSLEELNIPHKYFRKYSLDQETAQKLTQETVTTGQKLRKKSFEAKREIIDLEYKTDVLNLNENYIIQHIRIDFEEQRQYLIEQHNVISSSLGSSNSSNINHNFGGRASSFNSSNARDRTFSISSILNQEEVIPEEIFQLTENSNLGEINEFVS